MRQVKTETDWANSPIGFPLLLNSLIIDIKNLASRTASDKGFDLVGVELLTHLNPMSIQLQIRRQGGGDVSLEDCALLSKPIGDLFESSELLNQPYVLEISSPGINDLLTTSRDFETFKGFPVEVIFFNETKSEKKEIGLLHEKSEDFLKLNLKGKISTISMQDVIKVKLTTKSG